MEGQRQNLIRHSASLEMFYLLPAIIYISDNNDKTIKWCNQNM